MNQTAIESAQSFMRQQLIDGWLVYDFRGSSAVFSQLIPGEWFTTRRIFLFVPDDGPPELFVHQIDASQFADVPILKTPYLTWQELHAWLKQRLASEARIAMEYSPQNALPVVSVTDAGTIELVRGSGAGEIVSSGDLIQACIATWSGEAQANHRKASRLVNQAKDEAFDFIRQSLARSSEIDEYAVQQFIVAQFRQHGLEFPDPPIVAVNAHSGDPHFEVQSTGSSRLKSGDWVLFDLWARVPGDENIYSDITWVGCCGEPTQRHQEVFDVVRRARDACVHRAKQAWKSGEPVEGWQLDDAAREVIVSGGFSKFIRHRTGHSLSPGKKVHGLGVNIDNLETHDTRRLLPGIGFTVEPGVYLPEFGVRLEINVFVHPENGPTVTSEIQEHIVRI